MSESEVFSSTDGESVGVLSQSPKTTEAIEKKTTTIDYPCETDLALLRRNEKILRKAIPDANEFTIPTCFVISPVKFDEIDEERGSLDKIDRWLDNLCFFCDRVFDPHEGAVSAMITKLFEGSSMYLYLIDEKTMEPVMGTGSASYPLEITRPSYFVPKVLPLMRLSLKAVRMMNGAAGVCKCLGIPQSGLSLGKAYSFMGDLNPENCLSSYLKLQSVGSNSTALHDLVNFYVQKDSGDTFCDLSRVCMEGMSCWTTKENAEEIVLKSKNALKLEYPPDDIDIVMPLTISLSSRVPPKASTKPKDNDHAIVEGTACVINGLSRMFSTPKIHAHD